MTKFKGSEGEWKIAFYNQVICENKTIADCENWTFDKTGIKAEFNALLISKSKKMLEHLEYLIENHYIDDPIIYKETIDLIDEATNFENLKIK